MKPPTTPRRIARPPLIGRFIVSVFAAREVRESVQEDLATRFSQLAQRNIRGARRWYWIQSIQCLRPTFHITARSAGRTPSRKHVRHLMSGMAREWRHAARGLTRRPGFTLAALLTLGIGIGATTSIFSVVNGVLLRPLPYPEQDRLVNVWQVNYDWFDSPNPGLRSWANSFPLSMPVWRDWEELSPVFEDVGVYDDRRYLMSADDRPESVFGTRMTSGVWRSLAVQPLLGRYFNPDDDEIGALPVAVLGYGFWKSRFGGDPDILGRTVRLSETIYTVVGVMPPGFYFPNSGSSSLWTTFDDEEKSDNRQSQFLNAVARLTVGVSIPQAQREMELLTARLVESRGHNEDHGVRIVSRSEEVIGGVRSVLLVLFGAVGVVLLIVCANIANMLLVRSTERRRELAIRSALGAWRGRLVSQMLSEGLLLSVLGGAAGITIAAVTFKPLLTALPQNLPRIDEITIDYRVLLFAMGVSIAAGILAGALPAFRAAQTDVSEALQDGGRGFTGGRRNNRAQGALVVSEVALAFVLLLGAGLLVKSYARLTSVDRGFNTERLLIFALSISQEALNRPSSSVDTNQPPPAGVSSSHMALLSYVQRLEERLTAIPGVERAAMADNMPFMGGTSSGTTTMEMSSGNLQTTNLERSAVTPSYFRIMDIPISSGRAFSVSDGPNAELVAIVSRGAAEEYWPGENPVGRRLRFGGIETERPWRTVVGVAEDVRHQGLDVSPRPKWYLPFSQRPRGSIDVVLKTQMEPELIIPSVRDVVVEVDPTLPPPNVRELENVILTSVANPRFRTRLVSLFALLAAILAVIGVYGVLAYSMAQRTAEIGVRIALGASEHAVLRSVLCHGLCLAAIGLALGCAISLAAVRVLDNFLFQTDIYDPWMFAAATALLTAATLVASYLPAHRATKVDPVEALRAE